jgi:lipoate-protein ligase A
LLWDGTADGAVNMAVDEALLESAGSRAVHRGIEVEAPPVTVRFYRFARPTITFGYAQRLDDAVDASACFENGVDVVRRVTGGRALLHVDELTYSVTGCASGIFAGHSVREIYRLAIDPIQQALSDLGVDLDPLSLAAAARALSPSAHPRPHPVLPCLSVPTGHELTSRGRKLLPSAQRWRRRAFLQHGSLLRRVPVTLMRATTRLAEGPVPAIGLDELGCRSLDDETLVRAFEKAYERLFSEPASSSTLSEHERERVRQLESKYRSTEWIHRVP